MTEEEAQSLAERFVNMRSDGVTIKDIKQALVVLANYYEDHKGYNVAVKPQNRGNKTNKSPYSSRKGVKYVAKSE